MSDFFDDVEAGTGGAEGVADLEPESDDDGLAAPLPAEVVAGVPLSDPEPSDPEPSDPDLSGPEPSDPEPSDPEPSDPEPSDPAAAAAPSAGALPDPPDRLSFL